MLLVEEIDAWKQVKQAYENANMFLFGDERYCVPFVVIVVHDILIVYGSAPFDSVGDKNDVAALAPLVHGVNIKLEKAGGIRAGLATMVAARSQHPALKVWIGTKPIWSSLAACVCISLITSICGQARWSEAC